MWKDQYIDKHIQGCINISDQTILCYESTIDSSRIALGSIFFSTFLVRIWSSFSKKEIDLWWITCYCKRHGRWIVSTWNEKETLEEECMSLVNYNVLALDICFFTSDQFRRPKLFAFYSSLYLFFLFGLFVNENLVIWLVWHQLFSTSCSSCQA